MGINSIMIIDNNEIDIFLHKKVVEQAGINAHILTFTSAIDALDHLKLFENTMAYDSLLLPQVILLDIDMPQMNGFEFLNEFARLKVFKHNPAEIFMISSTVNVEVIKKAEQSCAGFIPKPLTPEKLLSHIKHTGLTF